jgi:deltex-like protein
VKAEKSPVGSLKTSTQGRQNSSGSLPTPLTTSALNPIVSISQAPGPASEVVRWSWEDDSQGILRFIDYDDETSSIIERAFKSGVTTTNLTHGFFGQQGGYKIDFQDMTQTKTATAFVRTLQRTAFDPVSKAKTVKSRSGAVANAPKGVKLNEKGLIQVTEEDVKRLVDPNAAGFAKPPETKKELIQRLTKYAAAAASEHECAICLCTLDEGVVELSECKHLFHEDCIIHAGNPKGYLKCPSCGVIYGVRIGSMPKGSMRIEFRGRGQLPLEGFENYGTVQITYSFPNGTQGVDHPEPGKSYNGTSRTAYLPDSQEGLDILALLEIAFWRKLTFRIGTSVTTGEQNAVVWNGVHHKTSARGGVAAWGYPDDTYFQRVREELCALGVVAIVGDNTEVRFSMSGSRDKVIQSV